MNTEPLVRKSLLCSWGRFWFNPVDPIGLHIIRLLTGGVIFFWLLAMFGYQNEFYGLQGWFDRQAFREAARMGDLVPEPIGWSILYVCGGNAILLTGVYILSLLIVGLFALGIATRLTAVLTWAIVASFLCNPAISYDADYLLLILAFYLMLGYVLLGLWNGSYGLRTLLLGSCDGSGWKLLPPEGSKQARASVAANLTLRLIQINFAIVIFVSALHKLQFGDWWSGLAFWYPLHPPMDTTPEQVRLEATGAYWYLFRLSLGQYILLAWQLAFPFLAWKRSWRVVLVGGALIGWIGSVVVYRLPVFGSVVFLASLCFVTAEEWRWLGKGLNRVAQFIRRSNEDAVSAETVGHRS